MDAAVHGFDAAWDILISTELDAFAAWDMLVSAEPGAPRRGTCWLQFGWMLRGVEKKKNSLNLAIG